MVSICFDRLDERAPWSSRGELVLTRPCGLAEEPVVGIYASGGVIGRAAETGLARSTGTSGFLGAKGAIWYDEEGLELVSTEWCIVGSCGARRAPAVDGRGRSGWRSLFALSALEGRPLFLGGSDLTGGGWLRCLSPTEGRGSRGA